MFLIDTSVWIDYLRQRQTRPATWLGQILDRDYPFGITGVIYQEILQGADSEASYQRLEAYFSTQVFFHPRDPVASHAEAARLYFRCRRAGLTLRSAVDCLIAQVAVEHDLLILHNDRDFDLLASVVPEVRIYTGGLTAPQPDTVHEPEASYG